MASVDASYKLRVATERLTEMRSKMGKKEREFSDSERDMQSAQREAESAQRESEEMKAVERQLAQQSGLGGGGYENRGGGNNDARAVYELKRDELSAMRGQLEEAKHTVMRAEELERLRRTAHEAFERSARESNSTQRRSNNQQHSPGTENAVHDRRGVPTKAQLELREAELRDMRNQLDRLYGRELEDMKGSVGRLEAHVFEMKSVMASANGGGNGNTFGGSPHTTTTTPPKAVNDRAGDEGYDPENDTRGRKSVSSSQTSNSFSSSQNSSNGNDEADRRAAQLALEEAEYVSREAKRRAEEIRLGFDGKQRALESMKRDIEGGHRGGGNDTRGFGGGGGNNDVEEKRRQALVTAAEASFRAKQADTRAKDIHAALDERRRELEWMRGEIEKAQRDLEPTRRAAGDAAAAERAADANAARLAEARRSGANDGGGAIRGRDEHPVDGHRQREAREASEQAKRDHEWVRGELTAKTDEASRAARTRDSMIEALELSLAGVETGPLEARYNAEDTATASFRIRQIEDRARKKAEDTHRHAGVPKQEELEHARSKAMAAAAAAEAQRAKTQRAETMAHEAARLSDTVAARCKVAEEIAEAMRVAARDAAQRRERLLQTEMQAAATEVLVAMGKIESLETLVAELETRGRELASVSRVAAAEARLAETDARDAAASAAAEHAATAKRLTSALHRAERELAAMEQAMVEELTSTETRLMETSGESNVRGEAMERMRRELMVEREKANLAMNEAKIQEHRALSARAEAETALAWQDGSSIAGERSLLVDDEGTCLFSQIRHTPFLPPLFECTPCDVCSVVQYGRNVSWRTSNCSKPTLETEETDTLFYPS